MLQTVKLQGNDTSIEGTALKLGMQAKEFILTTKELADVTLQSYGNKRKIINIFPSVDTGVCAESIRKFNQLASSLDNTVVLCISADLPFAQARFCGSESIENVVTLSTFRSPSFAYDYGVAISSGPLRGLTTRSVIVLDENNNVIYSELVPEITDEPNYDKAISELM
ncbi:thiol peroxidase [Providencia rettgeri]